jgi:O-acetyl-ADP-ribose deacetylase (regulator of RNase III)
MPADHLCDYEDGPHRIQTQIAESSYRADMLTYRRTSVMDSPAQTLVNTVNCVGVMGKGIAKAFKERYPAMFTAYKRICDGGLLEPGKLWLWQGPDHSVLNFPTKIHWRTPSRLEWIEIGLKKFAASYEAHGITSISFPRLGCGNGGLDWDDVRPLMEQYLAPIPIDIFIHDYERPIGLPEHLEDIVRRVGDPLGPLIVFDDFLLQIGQVIDVAEGHFEVLPSGQPFTASLDENSALHLQIGTIVSELEAEALRGIWLSLMSGLVTARDAGWSDADSGQMVLSLVSLLPQVRALEIHRSNRAEAEIALELKRHPTVAAPRLGDQKEMSWA